MVSSINFLGSYSGLDSSTVDSLIEAESGKLVQYTNKQASLTNEKNAWKDVNTRLSSLYEKIGSLTNVDTFQSKTSSTSDESKVSVTAKTGAQASNYSIQVQQLATSSQLTSNRITATSISEKLGLEGSFTLYNQEEKGPEVEEGKEAKKGFEIKISEKDSLKDIVGKINEISKESGIQAKLIDNRIILTDSQMGKRTIKVEGELSVDLGFVQGPEQLTIGQPALFSVDGIELESNTNEITDAIEGITLKLKGVTDSAKPVTVGIAEDTEKAVKGFQDFVDQYNSTLEFIGTQLDVGDPSAEGNKTGALVGDSTVIRLESSLRSLMTGNGTNGDGSVKNLGDLGISVDRYGKATLDTAKLKTALAENPKAAQEFFSHTVTTETGEIDDNGKPITVEKEEGMAQKMQTLINSYISEKTGIIATKSDTFDKEIKDISKSITNFNERLEKKRSNYIAMFTRLDTAMMQAESQMAYLASQFSTSSSK